MLAAAVPPLPLPRPPLVVDVRLEAAEAAVEARVVLVLMEPVPPLAGGVGSTVTVIGSGNHEGDMWKLPRWRSRRRSRNDGSSGVSPASPVPPILPT